MTKYQSAATSDTRTSRDTSLNSFVAWQRVDDIGIARIGDGAATDTIVTPTSGAEFAVVSGEMMYICLGKHGRIFDIAVSQRGASVRNQSELRLAIPQKS